MDGWSTVLQSSAATGSCANTRSAAYADARVQRIYGGTSEIMRELISRSLWQDRRDG